MLLFNQRQIMEPAKLNQQRPEDLANKDYHKSIYKEIFSKLVK